MVEGLLLIALWCSVPGNTTQNVNSCRERIFNCVENKENDDREDFIKVLETLKQETLTK